jgi:GNAT superfamily N-acetyltransferase
MSDLSIRPADAGDIPLILGFIRELAEYEKLLDQVTATEEILTKWIFDKQRAEVLIGEKDGQPVGYALFFYNFSTFLGRAGIYIEDVYVRPENRGKGYGKAFFRYIAGLCRDRLRPSRVVLPGLEQAQHRLLPVSRRGAHERLDDLQTQ